MSKTTANNQSDPETSRYHDICGRCGEIWETNGKGVQVVENNAVRCLGCDAICTLSPIMILKIEGKVVQSMNLGKALIV